MIRIMIVDDHPIVRQGLRAALQEASDMKVVEEAKDGLEVLGKARHCRPDVVLLDLSLPGRSGLEVLALIRLSMPFVKVLILSTYSEKQYAVRCLKNGAHGYVTKESAAEELMTAIRKVAQGRRYVSEALAEILAAEKDADTLALPHEELSDREFQVLCLLGGGKTVSEIAAKISLSLSSVNTYRSRILKKMRMDTTAQLMHYVLEHKLIDNVE